MHDEGERRFPRAPWIAAVVSFVAVAVVIFVQLLNQEGKADTTTLGLLLIGGILLFGIVAPAAAVKAADRITKLKVGALELGLKEIKRAERVRPVPSEDNSVKTIRPREVGYLKIVDTLKGRLRFVSQILEFEAEVKFKGKPEKGDRVDEDDEYDYRAIAAWLRKHEMLDQAEEAFVLDLLDGTGADLSEWDAATRKDFLDAAYAFSSRFGPKIWDRWVRRKLGESGWFLAGFDQTEGHRPDFLAHRAGKWALMTARVGGDASGYVEKAGPRLLRFNDFGPIDSRVIVRPEIREGEVKEKYAWGSDHPDGVRVLSLNKLLAHPGLPFAKPASPA